MVNRFRQIFASAAQNIDDDMQGFIPLKKFCDKFQIKPSYVFISFMLIAIIFTFIGVFSHIFVTIIGLLYPAYMSFKAAKNNSEEQSKQWLTYWIIFGLLTSFDSLISTILFFLPAYYTFKSLFFIWLFYPRTNGAHILYQKVFKPQLKNLKALSEKFHSE